MPCSRNDSHWIVLVWIKPIVKRADLLHTQNNQGQISKKSYFSFIFDKTFMNESFFSVQL